MAKFTLSITSDDIGELRFMLDNLTHAATQVPAHATGTNGPVAPATEAAEDPDAKKRGRPKKKDPLPGVASDAPSATREALQASVDATTKNDALPALDDLKHAITVAVRLAQKGEGDRAILQLLPAFKEKTGLDFVMNATDTHRRALFDLAQTAGVPLG